MKAAGVIVEFNPLHNGHIQHLQETVRLTKREHIVAVMSGNFVQRGEPALINKWHRTRMALLAGVDIVIELPVIYVISGAEDFAQGSVKLLAATNIVDKLCFGTECGDIAPILEVGRILADEPVEYKKALLQGLSQGMNFAAARGAALTGVMGDIPDGLLTKPNNTLGTEYVKALVQLGWPMEAYTSYRAEGGVSATAIRNAVWMGESIEGVPDFVSEITQNCIKTKETARLNDFSQIFRYMLYTTNIDMGEGLENRFRHFSKEQLRLKDLLDAVKTKRYTYTRLQRAALGVVLGINKKNMTPFTFPLTPPYIRILGFRREKADLLGEMTRNASLPVVTSGKDMDKLEGAAATVLAKEFEAGDIYSMAHAGTSGYRHERRMPIVIV